MYMLSLKFLSSVAITRLGARGPNCVFCFCSQTFPAIPSPSNFDFSRRRLKISQIENLPAVQYICITSLFEFTGNRSDMNWVQRKIYLYNVTFGLYMLDWWERYLFNALVIVLMWFVMYNGTRYFSELFKRSCFSHGRA
ncbi:hypothetical protein V5N11_015039 [Cardamine amara subsp. amara]|uniref:Uncharacterized protein n=1 Tax=Cardamine amara subsp. amara TaxID=228776 RepID=A0ABD1A5T1_CARAN